MFLTNLTVPNKQYFRVKLLVRLLGQVFNLQIMYEFKIRLLYNEKKNFYFTRTELLNFKIPLLLAKLDIVGSRPVSNGLIYSDDILVNIRFLDFLLLFNIRELSTGAKS